MELGWHPCLTLDRPLLPAKLVPSLIDSRGQFWKLGKFLPRLFAGAIRTEELQLELRAQLHHFHDLVGHSPCVVNSHHHIQIFPPVGSVIRSLLSSVEPRPYVRRVCEPLRTLVNIPGARAKRLFLNNFGMRDARSLRASGFPGNDWLAGVTNPSCVRDARFLVRWLARVPGHVVELTCHPGFTDLTLVGRDCFPGDGQLERRLHEYERLNSPTFRDSVRQNAFTLIAPSQWCAHQRDSIRSVA
jgi:predicted glycoside hydrolase/deacetylase ChbG (UPF0249 family)